MEIFDNNLKNIDNKLEDLANRLYRESRYKDALFIYTRIKNKSAYVLYNIGVCCIKTKEKKKSLTYTEEALSRFIDDIYNGDIDRFSYKILFNYIFVSETFKIRGKYDIYELLEIAKNSHLSKNDTDFNNMYELVNEKRV